MKWWKTLHQSLRTYALEKSEKLTTSVADLSLKLIGIFTASLKTAKLVTWGSPRGQAEYISA